MKLTEETFKKGMTMLGVVYERNVQDEDINAFYWLVLCDYPDYLVEKAFEQVIRTCKFFPKPAEIIQLITGGQSGGKDPTVAWTEVLNNLESRGGYESVTFQDGAIAQAIKGLGGWVALSKKK